MKHLSITMVILFAACQNATDAPPSEAEAAPPPAVTEAEWVTLFDGTDLNHFNMVGEAQWNIIDDYVEADGYSPVGGTKPEQYCCAAGFYQRRSAARAATACATCGSCASACTRAAAGGLRAARSA